MKGGVKMFEKLMKRMRKKMRGKKRMGKKGQIAVATQGVATAEGKKQVPTGIKILSILTYIGAFLIIIGGLAFLAISLIWGVSRASSEGIVFSGLGIGIGLIIGGVIFLLAIGMLEFLVARGLWKGKNWARIFTIVVQCIGILVGLAQLFFSIIFATLLAALGIESMGFVSAISGIPALVISALITAYLLFSKKVKEAFK